VLPPHIVIAHFFNKHGFTLGSFGRNLSQSKRKKILAIIILFATVGLGGVVAATSIAINSGSAISLGAGYTTATTCDASVTLKAKTALDASSGQLYVAAFELSDISQNATTGCGNKTMEMALKINGQMTYASWDIPASNTDSTFNFSAATISLSDYNAMTALTPFQADGLTNIAIGKIGSFNSTFNWTSSGKERAWVGIASSSDGTKLAAAIYGGYISTSINSGVSWRESLVPGVGNWLPIASSSDGMKLVAATYSWESGGYIYTSVDGGVSFTINSDTFNWWQSITSSSDGTKLAAGTWGDYIYTSTNSGLTWTPQTSSRQRVWGGITSSSDGTKLAAVDFGTGAGGYIYTSADSGATWTTNSNSSGSRNWNPIASSSDGTKLVAADVGVAGAGGYIYTSPDSGITWIPRASAGSRWWISITSSADGTKLAAAVNGGYIYTSTDSGVTWTEQTSALSRSWGPITSSSDGSKLAVVDPGNNPFSGTTGYIYTGVGTKTRSNN
jgi:hypothetical protein